MQFAICNELFEDWSFEDTCRFVAEAGYQALEIAPFTLTPDVRTFPETGWAVLRSRAEQEGLQIAGLHWLLAKPPGLHLTSADQTTRRETVDYLVALARCCASLGGRVMVLGSPKQRSLAPGVRQADAEEWLQEALKRVGDVAHPAGVTVCMEPLPAEDTNFVNRLEEAAAIVHDLDHPGVRLILDVKSMGAEGIPIPDLVRTYGPLAGHFHANDTNRRGPGDGETDFVPIFAALDDIGYTGMISVEVFDYTPDPRTIARNSLDYMKGALARARDEDHHEQPGIPTRL